MQQIKAKNFTDKIVLFCFSIAIYFGVVMHFIEILPSNIYWLTLYTSLGFGYVGLIIFFVNRSRSLYENKVFYLWSFIATYMLVIGFIFTGAFPGTTYSLSWLTLQDLRYVMFVGIGFAFANDKYIIDYHRMMKILGIIAIVFGILSIMNYQFNISLINTRIGVWSLPYYYWWLSTAIFAYHYAYSKITGKNKVIGYGVFAVYTILGILFLKRSVLINVLFLVVITEILQPSKVTSNRLISRIVKVLLFILIIVIFYLMFNETINRMIGNSYVGEVFNSLFERFKSDDLSTYDRSAEKNIYFSTATNLQILFGNGLGNLQILGGKLINALHIGAYNIIYKGGLIYVIFWIYLLSNFIKAFMRKRQLSKYLLVCLTVALSASFSMLYEFSFTYSILPIGYSTAIAYIVQNQKRKE